MKHITAIRNTIGEFFTDFGHAFREFFARMHH